MDLGVGHILSRLIFLKIAAEFPVKLHLPKLHPEVADGLLDISMDEALLQFQPLPAAIPIRPGCELGATVPIITHHSNHPITIFIASLTDTYPSLFGQPGTLVTSPPQKLRDCPIFSTHPDHHRSVCIRPPLVFC